ncbi:hypothetical protein TNCV_2965811, partial [Trichonephila clavipes]
CKEAEKKYQKEQHSNILLKGVFEITTRNHLEGLTATLHGIPDVLEDSCHIKYPLGSYRYLIDEVFN